MISWLMEMKLIAKIRLCPLCDSEMRLVECGDRLDGCKWECRRQAKGKRHKVEVSICKGSWFEGSNLTLEEILKREYHRGHRVEGQWVFGGIKEGSRKSFMFADNDRSEATLLPIIKTFIEKGTTIISDCSKAHCNLEKHGYKHLMVNHSKEFVNSDRYHTNKIKGHWRQAKAKFPPFGIHKYTFSSYLAEFLWRYEHKDEDLFEVFLDDCKKFMEDIMRVFIENEEYKAIVGIVI